MNMNSVVSHDWWVYIVECADGTFYTGVARDVDRRVEEHNHNTVAARYTRARRPVRLVYKEGARDRSWAQKRESEIKRMTRLQKILLIDGNSV
ncbi:MAG: GIY-YIG nuclease family protein [Gammaproteobacteria bacterium]|nr:MAG: GIY-YIG nuclease family protein [Gammaproteobacteria bacterium]